MQATISTCRVLVIAILLGSLVIYIHLFLNPFHHMSEVPPKINVVLLLIDKIELLQLFAKNTNKFLFLLQKTILINYFIISTRNVIKGQLKMKQIFLLSILVTVISTAVHHPLIDTHPQQLSTQPIHEGFTGGSGSAFFGGFILGPLLFFSTCICIWFNEKRAAIDSRRLKLAASICEIVDVNNQASADYQNGKLVYACGQTMTDSITRDSVSGVMSPNLIKISRYVEVMEWRRHTRNTDRTPETYHTLSWRNDHSESEGIYRNPPENWFIQNEVTYNNQVFLGGYTIDKDTADLCEKVIPFTPTMEHANNIMMNTANRERTPYISGQYIYFSKQNGQQGEGDLRVKFILCPTGDLSIAAQSKGYTFAPFPIAQYEGTTDQKNSVPDCCCCCISQCYASLLEPLETIHLVKEENFSQWELFNEAIKKSECLTRSLRIACYLLLVASICLFFSPITTLIGYIPLVGGFISGVLFFAILLGAIIICIPLFFFALSVAWLRFHPKIGIVLLLIGLVALGVILFINFSKGGGAGAGASHLLSLRNGHI